MSIWTELLFQHGHVADVELARSLARSSAPAPDGCGCDACREASARRAAGGPAPDRCRGTFPAHGLATLCATALSPFR